MVVCHLRARIDMSGDWWWAVDYVYAGSTSSPHAACLVAHSDPAASLAMGASGVQGGVLGVNSSTGLNVRTLENHVAVCASGQTGTWLTSYNTAGVTYGGATDGTFARGPPHNHAAGSISWGRESDAFQ